MAPPSLPRLESPLPAEQMDQQLAIVVASGGDPIASSPAPATSAAATPPVPPTSTPVARADIPRGSGDALHHTTNLTPPASIPLGALITPDPGQRIHPVSISSDCNCDFHPRFLLDRMIFDLAALLSVIRINWCA